MHKLFGKISHLTVISYDELTCWLVTFTESVDFSLDFSEVGWMAKIEKALHCFCLLCCLNYSIVCACTSIFVYIWVCMFVHECVCCTCLCALHVCECVCVMVMTIEKEVTDLRSGWEIRGAGGRGLVDVNVVNTVLMHEILLKCLKLNKY